MTSPQAHNTSILKNNENQISEIPEKDFFTKLENNSKIWIKIQKTPNSQINPNRERAYTVQQ